MLGWVLVVGVFDASKAAVFSNGTSLFAKANEEKIKLLSVCACADPLSLAGKRDT
jgi:hypothetical protein